MFAPEYASASTCPQLDMHRDARARTNECGRMALKHATGSQRLLVSSGPSHHRRVGPFT
jgi:hypothetical protein